MRRVRSRERAAQVNSRPLRQRCTTRARSPSSVGDGAQPELATQGDPMIELYYWTTPNGHKVTIFLEEVCVPYRIHPVNIGKGDQFKPNFLALSPNNRIPAILDTAPPTAAHRSASSVGRHPDVPRREDRRKLLPTDVRGRFEVMEWLFWQMAGLGPMAGQNRHFLAVRARAHPLCDGALRGRDRSPLRRIRQAPRHRRPRFIAGDYSIATWQAIRGSCRTRRSSRASTTPASAPLVRDDARSARR